MLVKMWRKGKPHVLLVGMLIRRATMETLWKPLWKFFKRLKIELPHDPEILLLGKTKTPI